MVQFEKHDSCTGIFITGAIKEAQVLVRIEVVYIENTEQWPIL